MKIAVIGAGQVGVALAQGWAQAGHTIVFGVRDNVPRMLRNKGQDVNGDRVINAADNRPALGIVVGSTHRSTIDSSAVLQSAA